MKKIMLFIFLVSGLTCFTQEFKIPVINFKDKSETQNVYIDLLNLKDPNSIIVRLDYRSHWIESNLTQYIVYQTDGKVLKYKSYQNKITKKRVKKRNCKYYWKLLNDCVSQNLLDIDYTKLDITTKPINDKTSSQMTVTDGLQQGFEITKQSEYTVFSTYAAEAYIKKQYPGFEERQKLVDLMNRFDDSYRKY